MRIDPSKPHEIIYSLSNEEGMGYLIYGYAIQLGDNGKHTLQYQRVNPQNIRDFKDFDTEQNRQVLREIEEYGPTEITKRFSKKNEKPTEFLKKFLTEENLEKIILPYCQLRLANILDLLKGTTIYLKNRDNPVDTALFVEPTDAQIEFNFERNEQGTRYFPNIFHKNTYI
ncbi:hypothetical protein GC194_09320, partial [bacterium]|nr:hypothetical protein [bacterium]